MVWVGTVLLLTLVAGFTPFDCPNPYVSFVNPSVSFRVFDRVVCGLNNPRGIAATADGFYVAEAGFGGNFDQPDEFCLDNADLGEICLGNSAGLVHFTGTSSARILANLPSVGQVQTCLPGQPGFVVEGLNALGLAGVALYRGELYGLLTDTPLQHSALLRFDGAAHGTVTPVPVADLHDFEFTVNPDGAQLQSDPFGVVALESGEFFITDSAGNSVVRVYHGHVSTVTFYAPKNSPGSTATCKPTYEGVPTGVAFNPRDDQIYVGLLTGFPYPAGAATVHKLQRHRGSDIEHDTFVDTVYATGFTMIIAIAFDEYGNLFVLEQNAAGGPPACTGPNPPTDCSVAAPSPLNPDFCTLAAGGKFGSLWKVSPHGEKTLILGPPDCSAGHAPIDQEPLINPGGMTYAGNGILLITNRGNLPSIGEVIRVDVRSLQHGHEFDCDEQPYGADVSFTLLNRVICGLNNPRGIALFGQDGILVTEAGVGGNFGNPASCIQGNGDTAGDCIGNSGAIVRKSYGKTERILKGFFSYASPQVCAPGQPGFIAAGQQALGLSGLAVDRNKAYAVIAFRIESASNSGKLESIKGFDDNYDEHPSHKILADLGGFEVAHNPDQVFSGPVDSDPFEVLPLPNGEVWVTDAAGNDLLRWSHGQLSVVHVWGPQPTPVGAVPPLSCKPNYEFVPTGLAYNYRDGNVYVGQLTGFPFPPQQASVYKVVRTLGPAPDGSLDTFQVSTYVQGFTNIIAIQFDEFGNLYVLEHSHVGLGPVGSCGGPVDCSQPAPNPLSADLCSALPAYEFGALWQVSPLLERTLIIGAPDCSQPLKQEPLVRPTALTYQNGKMFISNRGSFAGIGEVVKVDVTPYQLPLGWRCDSGVCVPRAPQVRVKSEREGVIKLSWKPLGPTVTTLEIDIVGHNNVHRSIAVAPNPGFAKDATVTGLPEGHDYRIRLIATTVDTVVHEGDAVVVVL